jgi:hypothetical protein
VHQVCDARVNVYKETPESGFADYLANLEHAEWVEEMARSLIAKLDALQPAIDTAFTLMWVHGQKHNGPTYGKELEDLRRLL